MTAIGIVSFRLGGTDGVSIEAAKWAGALAVLGADVVMIAGAGEGSVTLIDGLGIDDTGPVDDLSLERVIEGLDVVVVENLCSLPLNPRATESVATALAGRPALLRHHDLAWRRRDTAWFGAPPDDPSWRHVAISQMAATELAEHGIEARCIYNRFDLDPPAGRRAEARAALGIDVDRPLILQPTRALERKNVPAGIELARSLGGEFWLTGEAEDGYGPTLAELVERAEIPVHRGLGSFSMDDAYAAADVVVLPSTWEGFGNPMIESVAHRVPLALSHYPVAEEIRSLGFSFFEPDRPGPILDHLDSPDPALAEHNLEIARAHFSLRDLPGILAEELRQLGIEL